MSTLRSPAALAFSAIVACAAAAWGVILQYTPRPGEHVPREVDPLSVIGVSLAAFAAALLTWRLFKELRGRGIGTRLLASCALALCATGATFLLVAVPTLLYAATAVDLSNAWTIPIVIFFGFANGLLHAFVPALPYGLAAGVVFWLVAERYQWLRECEPSSGAT